MLDPVLLASVRRGLLLSQEQMAKLLGVSFASVNRWEAGHSSPTGPISDLYSALHAALQAGHSHEDIVSAANNERGIFLRTLFNMAYAERR